MNKSLLIIVTFSILFLSCKRKLNTSGEKDTLSINYLMDTRVNSILKNPKINSISIGIYKDGKEYKRYYGEIDKGKKNKATDNSIFEIASVTKTFTAYITAKAVLEGKLKLDDDIRKYLNGSYENLEINNRPILVRDILTHTSGINRENFSQVLSKIFSIDLTDYERKTIAEYSKESFIKDLKSYNLTISPGKKYDYSGFVAPEVLAIILEKVYQKPYKILLEEFILKKANMHHTSLQVSNEDRKYIINGYTDNNKLVIPLKMPLTGAGGGLKSTVPDMLKYIKFLLEDKDSIVAEMRKPLFYDSEEEDEYGYFWMVEGDELLLHNGGTGGSVNWLILLPKINSGFTISFNYNGDEADDLINSLASNLISDLITNSRQKK